MIRRLLMGVVWTVVAIILGSYGSESVLLLMQYLGLGLESFARVAVGFVQAVFTVTLAVSAIVMSYRGSLPLTARADAGEGVDVASGDRSGRTWLGWLVIFVSTGLLAVIVSASVATEFAEDVREHRITEGAADGVVSFDSEILREHRDVRIELPSDYGLDPDRTYPVLFVLDGTDHLEHTARAADVLYRAGLGGQIIVAAVVNGATGRNADFVPPPHSVGPGEGRGDLFLRFLKEEAIPAVEDEVRSNGVRLLAGHSLGGLFAGYALIEEPDLFRGIFAFSPSWWVADGAYARAFEEDLEVASETYFYTSLGSEEGIGMLNAFRVGMGALESAAPDALDWEGEVIDGADHGNNPVRSTPAALRGFWESVRAAEEHTGGSPEGN